MNDAQIEEAEKLLSYYDIHGAELFVGVHVEGWTADAAALLRSALPEWSAFKASV